MHKTLSAEQVLIQKGFFATTVVGTSMLPMLKERRDTVVVKPLNAPPKKYDVVLFRRDGQLVLHRVVGRKDDHFLIRGDNCIGCDRATQAQILGKMTSFTRKGKQRNANSLLWRHYGRFWVLSFPVRRLWGRVKRRFHER